MIDHWVGRGVRRARASAGCGSSTAVIVCTDHGHYLGEKDIWGKPRRHAVRATRPHAVAGALAGGPGRDRVRRADDQRRHSRHRRRRVRRAAARGRATGRRWSRCCGRTDGRRCGEWAIGGVYGNWVQVTDGRRKYARGAAGDNFPLSMWSNRWSTMPVHGLEDAVRLPPPDRRARLDFMPGSDVPVIRQPFEPGDRLPFWVGAQRGGRPLPLRPRRGPGRGREPGAARRSRRTWWTCCAPPWCRWTPRASSSSGLGIA